VQPASLPPKQEEKKDVKTAKTSHFIDKNLFVSQQRSNLLTMGDRHQLEQEVMKQIESGGGLLGTTKINLVNRKKAICNVDDKKELPQNQKLIQMLEADGLYIDSALNFKNRDINVQKLEERLLNTGQSEYFKLNGELKMHNDILADELTRPADLAFEQSDAF